MAIAVAFANSTGLLHNGQTVNVTGGAAATAYNVVLTTPNGHTQTLRCVTDGTGAASVQFVPDTRGSYSASVIPVLRSDATAGGSTFKAV